MTAARHRVLVLGGYGNFGKIISERLSLDPRLSVIVAGRDRGQAEKLASHLSAKVQHAAVYAQKVDIHSRDFQLDLARSRAQTVVNTCGPFHANNYATAETCVQAGVNYIDLADDRSFVDGIRVLDVAARSKNVTVVSGASTVPALTSAVIDAYIGEFSRLLHVESSLSPGNRAPRGLATVQSVLGYCGKPFTRFEGGGWQTVYGWMDAHRRTFAGLTKPRVVANCNVPDLELFPRRYPTLQSYRFWAGMELRTLQYGIALMAYITRIGLVSDWSRYASVLKTMSEWMLERGSDIGVMHMRMIGERIVAGDIQRHQVDWGLCAASGHGPHIPCTPAIVAVQKIVEGHMPSGAHACVGLMTLADIMNSLKSYDISSSKNGLGGDRVGDRQDQQCTDISPFQRALGDEGSLHLFIYLTETHSISCTARLHATIP